MLVDTHAAELRALRQLGVEMGAALPADFESRIAGRKMSESVDLVASLGVGPAPADAVAHVRQLAEEFLGSTDIAVPGVRAALESIRGDKYIVSNSPLDLIEGRIERADIARHFSGPHFSAYEYGVWKPNPGLYRKAVQSLGASLESVIAIEDSMVGVCAARGAGVRVLHFTGMCHNAAPALLSVCSFSSMDELPALVDAGSSGWFSREARHF